VFREESDYQRYLELLRTYSRRYALAIAGYCLMTNHVHVVGEPRREDSIAKTFKYCHGVYATEFNKKYRKSGHLWQARPFSCVLDEAHAWAALRYVERNPVRAGMVPRAENYRWPSAPAHRNMAIDALLSSNWPAQGAPDDWKLWLGGKITAEQEQRIRDRTLTGRPCGDDRFVKTVEQAARRTLAPQKRGSKPSRDEEAVLPTLPWTSDEIRF